MMQQEASPMLPGGPVGYGKNPNAPIKFDWTWKVLFFAMAAGVTAGGIMGIWTMVTSLEAIIAPFDLVVSVYLTVFGLLMLSLDMPFQLNVKQVTIIESLVWRYCLFLTRMGGKGIFYVFLGCMTMGTLWDNDVAPFLGLVLGGAIVFGGILALIRGVRVSHKLDMVRKALYERGGPTPSICPPNGLPMAKFEELAMKIKGVAFSSEELSYIANALSNSHNADDVISQREFESWLQTPSYVIV